MTTVRPTAGLRNNIFSTDVMLMNPNYWRPYYISVNVLTCSFAGFWVFGHKGNWNKAPVKRNQGIGCRPPTARRGKQATGHRKSREQDLSRGNRAEAKPVRLLSV